MAAAIFFFVSKIIWSFLMPANFLISLLAIGIMLTWFKARLSRAIITLSGMLLLLIAVLPVGNMMLRHLEQIYPVPALPQQVDGIIVLGGFLDADRTFYYGQPVLSDAAERLVMFMQLAKQYPNARLLMTGGNGNPLGEEKREADAVQKIWPELGGDPARLMVERDSRNTRENFANSKAIANPQPGENWVVITSAFHMQRAINCYHEAGWQAAAIPYPVDFRADLDERFLPLHFTANLEKFDLAAKEWLGLRANQMF